MDSDWNRIAKDFLFEKSIRDKNNHQITLLQSWRKIVAIIIQDSKKMIRTRKHYSYNVTTALDKLVKQQKLINLVLTEKDMYNLLIEKFGEGSFFKNWDNDIEWCDPEDDCPVDDEESEEDDEYPWDEDDDPNREE